MDRNFLRYGLVGGGPGSFIGDVHRRAAKFDGRCRLKAGALSSEYEKTLTKGRELNLTEERLYRSYEKMASEEASRDDGIDFVSITVPNHLHHKVARVFLENGISVVCDKPVTTTVDEAKELEQLAEDYNLLFCVTYTYSGYPMVKEAKSLISEGKLGDIRVVSGEYPQDWLAEKAEDQGAKQAKWRTDPERAGISNCMGDIGSHIEHTVRYITGLEMRQISANLNTFVPGRELDDNGEVLVKFKNGATGTYWASQVAIGNDNGLEVRVYGNKGGLEWEQENPNYLKYTPLGQPTQILSRGHDYLGDEAAANSRVPPGHPEGYFEAFANIYTNFADALLQLKKTGSIQEREFDYPTLTEAKIGVEFIHKCVESSQNDSQWLEF